MIGKQLSEFVSLWPTMVVDCHFTILWYCEVTVHKIESPLSINVFLKTYKKTGNFHHKEGGTCKKKTQHLTLSTLTTIIKKIITFYVWLNYWIFFKISVNNFKKWFSFALSLLLCYFLVGVQYCRIQKDNFPFEKRKTVIETLPTLICVYIYIYVCVCVCARARDFYI